LKTTAWREELYLPADFTIECWLNTDTVSVGEGYILSHSAGWAIGWPSWSLFRTGTSLYFSSYSSDTSTAALVNIPFGNIEANKWYHVAITREGNNWRTFVNGVLMTTTVKAGVPYRDTSKGFSIGGDTAGYIDRFFEGHIDEIRITKGSARYTATFTPPARAFPNS
jgi:hypothetical protein